MSLVGGDAPRGAPDMTDLLVEVARNGPAFAERMDLLRKAKADADAALVVFGTIADLEKARNDAKADREAAAAELAGAQEQVRKLLDVAKAEAAYLKDQANVSVQEALAVRDTAVADAATARTEAARIREEAKQVRLDADTYADAERAKADALLREVQDRNEAAANALAQAAEAKRVAEEKLAALMAVMRG